MKEMRPSHRTDVIAHGLIYYGMKSKQKLGMHLCLQCHDYCRVVGHTASLLFSRWERASQLKLVSEEAYTKLVTESKLSVSIHLYYSNDISFVDGNVSEKELQEWMKEQTVLGKSSYGMRTSELPLISHLLWEISLQNA